MNSSWDPPRLYSWTIVPGERCSRSNGALGVTVDHDRALSAVSEALHDAPVGARGLVHRVALSFSRVGYFYEGLVARCRIRPETGAVVWDDLPVGGSWSRSAPALSDPPDLLNDGIPPEGVVTGLADLQVHQERLRNTTSAAVNAADNRIRPWV